MRRPRARSRRPAPARTPRISPCFDTPRHTPESPALRRVCYSRHRKLDTAIGPVKAVPHLRATRTIGGRACAPKACSIGGGGQWSRSRCLNDHGSFEYESSVSRWGLRALAAIGMKAAGWGCNGNTGSATSGSNEPATTGSASKRTPCEGERFDGAERDHLGRAERRRFVRCRRDGRAQTSIPTFRWRSMKAGSVTPRSIRSPRAARPPPRRPPARRSPRRDRASLPRPRHPRRHRPTVLERPQRR